MAKVDIPPNRLADLYDALYTVLETLPSETHPAWELAIESVLFGGEGISSGVTPFGEQQAKQNDFKISDYRAQYGDGDRVTEFPTLSTKTVSSPEQYSTEEVHLPKSPDTTTPIPLYVDNESLQKAIRLLNAFPVSPGSETGDRKNTDLLNPYRFPGLAKSTSDGVSTGDREGTEQGSTNDKAISSNELADLYDGLYTVLNSIPNETHPRWKAAIESILFGGEYLRPEASSYGEQQAERNAFEMSDYRSHYGDGNHVTSFPVATTAQPADDNSQYVEPGTVLPVAPDSREVLPLAPTEQELQHAAQLLVEFPSQPDANSGQRCNDSLFDLDAFLSDIPTDTQPTDTGQSGDSQTGMESNLDRDNLSSQNDTRSSDKEESPATSMTKSQSDGDTVSAEPQSSEPTVLRDESAGESTTPVEPQNERDSEGCRKYDDPNAERAHRRAQQRDPSDVVELGEEIRLTIKQVDYGSHPPTIMGTKNRLVVFVIDAPQDLSEYETIQAKVVDYGGKNNSAEAAFSGYVD